MVETILAKKYIPTCGIEIGDESFVVDLIILEMLDSCVILGRNCLSKHNAILNCLSFKILIKPIFIDQADRSMASNKLISTIKAKKLFII